MRATRRGPAVLLALGGGLVVATQARVNGQFSAEVGDPAGAAMLSAATGLAVITAVGAMSAPIRAGVLRLPDQIRQGALPWWALLVGTLGGFFLFSQTYAVPRLGVSVYAVLIVASITGAGLAIDRAGLGPAGRQHVTMRRLVGAALAVVAATVAAGPDLTTGSLALGAAAVAILAGAGGATQSAILGRVGIAARQPLAATWVNFVGATLALALLVAIASAGGAMWTVPPLGWLWLGGPLGLTIVVIIVITVPRAGVLLASLAMTAGQLVGALLWDVLAPVAGREVDGWAVAGAALLMLAVWIASGLGRASRPPAPGQGMASGARGDTRGGPA